MENNFKNALTKNIMISILILAVFYIMSYLERSLLNSLDYSANNRIYINTIIFIILGILISNFNFKVKNVNIIFLIIYLILSIISLIYFGSLMYIFLIIFGVFLGNTIKTVIKNKNA